MRSLVLATVICGTAVCFVNQGMAGEYLEHDKIAYRWDEGWYEDSEQKFLKRTVYGRPTTAYLRKELEGMTAADVAKKFEGCDHFIYFTGDDHWYKTETATLLKDGEWHVYNWVYVSFQSGKKRLVGGDVDIGFSTYQPRATRLERLYKRVD